MGGTASGPGSTPDVPIANWNRVARFYDLQLRSELAALDAAVELAAAGREDRLLDVATGTGGCLRRLARRPSRPDRAVGVDASAGMLARVPSLPPGWELQRETPSEKRGLVAGARKEPPPGKESPCSESIRSTWSCLPPISSRPRTR